MGKIRTGNKKNAFLNKEWSKVKNFTKKLTSSRRRVQSKAITKKERDDQEWKEFWK